LDKRWEDSELREEVAPARLNPLALPGFSSNAPEENSKEIRQNKNVKINLRMKNYLLATAIVVFFERLLDPEVLRYRIYMPTLTIFPLLSLPSQTISPET